MDIFFIDTDKGLVLVAAPNRQAAYQELWAAGFGILGLARV